MSPKDEVARMRGSNSRRCSSKRDADEADDAGDAADHDRQHLLEAVARCRACRTPQIGVSRPTKWPSEDHEDADVEQVRAPHQLAAAQQLARAVRHVYCSRSKRSRLPSRNTVRQR